MAEWPTMTVSLADKVHQQGVTAKVHMLDLDFQSDSLSWYW